MNPQTLNSSRKTIIVSDKYRTNPLSHQPGGWTVRVYYQSGVTKVYDKVKNVEAYTRYMQNKFNVVNVEKLNYVD